MHLHRCKLQKTYKETSYIFFFLTRYYILYYIRYNIFVVNCEFFQITLLEYAL